MTTAVFAGPDSDGLGTALDENGVDVSYVEGMASRPKLEEAGIHDAALFVLTDVGQATAEFEQFYAALPGDAQRAVSGDGCAHSSSQS